MFQNLQRRWKVGGWSLVLIITTFALGGSLCGYLGRKILLLSGLEKGVIWLLIYIILITLLWPFCVLLVSIPLGQFSFFRNYIGKIMSKFKGKPKVDTTRMAIFASGAGSNARKIIKYFQHHPSIEVSLVVSNNPSAGVLQIADEFRIPSLVIGRESLNDDNGCLEQLKNRDINFIVMAGFLWKLPPSIINSYPRKIVNIHPALLPAYGGKGMYGKHVHEAVIQNQEQQSGITIHLADELYDHGEVLFQASCTVEKNDTPDSLADKIHQLEHRYYAAEIENYLEKQNPR